MSAEAQGTDAERRTTWLLMTALAVFAVLTATVLVQDAWRHLVDSAIYILCSDSLSAGHGYQYLGQPFFVRPPGLSVLLLPFSGRPYDFHALNQVVQVAAALGFGSVLLVMRRLHGPLLGALAALLYALNLLTLETFNHVLAEFPFIALFFLGAWLVMPDRTGRQPSLRRAVPGALLVGASLWFRTVGVLLLPPLVAIDLTRRTGRRWQGALLAAVAALVILPWTLHARAAAREAERPSTQLLMFDYSTAMFHADPSDPDSPWVDLDGWLDRLTTNARDMSVSVGHLMAGLDNDPDDVSPAHVLVTALVALACLVTWLRRRSLLDGYAALMVAVLLLYFTFADRLLLPIVPLLLSAVVDATARLGGWLGRRLHEPHLRTNLVTVLAGLLLAASVVGFEDALQPTEQYANIYNADHEVAAWIEHNLPPDAVLLHEKGPVMTVLTGRTTYTWRNLPDTWPAGCPPVDAALFGPRPSASDSEGHERAVSQAAVRSFTVPVPWHRQVQPLRVYLLPDAAEQPVGR